MSLSWAVPVSACLLTSCCCCYAKQPESLAEVATRSHDFCDATESLDERTADVFSSLAEQSCHMCKWTFKALHLLLHGEVKRTCFVHGS